MGPGPKTEVACPGRGAHSILILFLLMTSRQRAVSASTNAAVSAGGVATGSAPTERYFVCTSGMLNTPAKSAASRCASSGGILGGPATANHEVETKPGNPDSAAVGTSGIDAARLTSATASTLSLPSR